MALLPRHSSEPVPDIDQRLELLTHGEVSSSYLLHSFQVLETQNGRAIRWYNENNNLLVTHLVPRGKVPYTGNEDFEVTYRDMEIINGITGQYTEILHHFAFPGQLGRLERRTPNYYFANEQQSVRFQSAARQRQLLRTFATISIRTHSSRSFKSHGQQLKLWQKCGESTITFTFFAHRNVDPVHHFEFDLAWFKQDVSRFGSRGLVLTFHTREERRKSSDGNMGKMLTLFQRRSSASQTTAGDRNKSTSSHSRSSSSSSGHRALPDGDRVVTDNQVYLEWRSLHIEFANDDDVEKFFTTCHSPETAPGALLAPDQLWKISHVSDGVLHLLKPLAGAFTSIRKISPVNPTGSVEDKAVSQARDWFNRLFILKDRFFHVDDHKHYHINALDEGIPPVGIAVLDTGIDSTNPYIKEMWKQKSRAAEQYRSFVEESTDSMDDLASQPYNHAKVSQAAQQLIAQLRQRDAGGPRDDTGHGTHVAGIILQLCSESNLYVGRVLAKNVTEGEIETQTAARRLALAILYATEVWKVKIISLSIGFRKTYLDEADKSILRNAIRYASNKDVLIFAAASNDGNRDRILFPAGEPEPFCINSSNGNGHASEFNPPHQEHDENFSILGEGVSSSWLQTTTSLSEDGSIQPTWEIRRGTSVATPIAASVAAIIIHFGRQWEPEGHEKLETRRGIRCILRSMVPKRNTEKFYDIVPWFGVFELNTKEFKDPVKAASEKIANRLDSAY